MPPSLGGPRLGEVRAIRTEPRNYSRDWHVPTSFGVWGGTAEDRAKLAWALALRIDRDLHWLQVEDSTRTQDAGEMSIVSQVGLGRLFIIDPADLAPHPELATLANWIVREEIDTDARIRTLADFMRLPTLARRLLRDRAMRDSTRAVVLANSDRAAEYYAQEKRGIGPFVEAMNEYGTTPIFTVVGSVPPRNAADVDYVFHIEPGAGAASARVECSQGAPSDAAGLFRPGPSHELAEFLRELRRA